MADLALIGDIGGTNARFALTDKAASEPRILEEQTLTDHDFRSLREAASHYLHAIGARPKHAALAVASPITGDTITLTNRDWSFDRNELQQALGLDRLRLVNDFAAVGWAAPHLSVDHRVRVHGAVATTLAGPVTLVGAGTGLGIALLVGSADRGWQVIATEGGHASFASTDDEERSIAAWLQARYGRVSNERALSGDGLSNIDAALRGLEPVATPADQPGARSPQAIVEAAMDGSDIAAKHALDRFCHLYGAVAGDAALLHGARTVLVAGGMVLHFLDFFLRSGFMEAFTAKGRHADYMDAMAVQVITHPNPGLLGAAVAARSPGT